jgi:acetyltransferase-like isoleucine patch superfamily enzyme
MPEIQRSKSHKQRHDYDDAWLHLYSLGIVTRDKLPDVPEIVVTPLEHITNVAGDIDNFEVCYPPGHPNHGGGVAGKKICKYATVEAKWLALTQDHRSTVPDICQGEKVVLYKYGNVEEYFWVTMEQDLELRRLETVRWAFSNTPDIMEKTDSKDKTYWFEVSTKEKHIILQTADNNGEVARYKIKIDTKKGFFTIADNHANYIQIDSVKKIIEVGTNTFVVNAPESFFKGNVTIDEWALVHGNIRGQKSAYIQKDGVIGHDLRVGHNGSIGNDLTVGDDTDIGGNCSVGGKIKARLSITAGTLLSGLSAIIKTSMSAGTGSFESSMEAGGLVKGGSIESNSTVSATGDVTSGGEVSATGDVTSGGNVTSVGNVTSGGEVTATGNVTSGGEVSATGDVTSGGNMSATGNVDVGGDLSTSGASSAASLSLTGDLTAANGVFSNGLTCVTLNASGSITSPTIDAINNSLTSQASIAEANRLAAEAEAQAVREAAAQEAQANAEAAEQAAQANAAAAAQAASAGTDAQTTADGAAAAAAAAQTTADSAASAAAAAQTTADSAASTAAAAQSTADTTGSDLSSHTGDGSLHCPCD